MTSQPIKLGGSGPMRRTGLHLRWLSTVLNWTSAPLARWSSFFTPGALPRRSLHFDLIFWRSVKGPMTWKRKSSPRKSGRKTSRTTGPSASAPVTMSGFRKPGGTAFFHGSFGSTMGLLPEPTLHDGLRGSQVPGRTRVCSLFQLFAGGAQ